MQYMQAVDGTSMPLPGHRNQTVPQLPNPAHAVESHPGPLNRGFARRLPHQRPTGPLQVPGKEENREFFGKRGQKQLPGTRQV